MAIKSWIDNPQTAIANGKLCTYTEFNNLTARKNGFSSGDVISSKEVNSALRQANMVASALCYAVGAGNSFSIESNTNELRNYFEAYFEAVVENVSYDTSTRKLTVKFKDGRVKNLNLGDFPIQAESAEKDGNGNVITETYATKVELANYATVGQLSDYVTQSIANATYATQSNLDQAIENEEAHRSWSEEYDPSEPMFRCLLAAYWGDYSPDSGDGNENQILIDEHEVTNADNLIISIDKSATKAQCEAFYDALLVPVMVDEDIQIIVKALGDIPSIDIPVTVMRV